MSPRSSRAPARWLLSCLCALLALGACGGDDEALSRDEVIARDLRAGGLVLVLRHSLTDTATNMQEILGDCARQRNLSVAGQDQARAIGDALREADVPVGEVRTSPMCRTRDTAELAFPDANVIVDEMLVTAGVTGTEADDMRRVEELKELATQRPQDGNLVLVTHTGNIGGAFGEETVNEGDVLVLRPQPDGADVLTTLSPDEWDDL